MFYLMVPTVTANFYQRLQHLLLNDATLQLVRRAGDKIYLKSSGQVYEDVKRIQKIIKNDKELGTVYYLIGAVG